MFVQKDYQKLIEKSEIMSVNRIVETNFLVFPMNKIQLTESTFQRWLNFAPCLLGRGRGGSTSGRWVPPVTVPRIFLDAG